VSVAELTSSVQVGRQGIYDRDRQVVAYEMLFRPMKAGFGLATEADHERATSQVISSIFGDFGVADIADSRSLFINVTRAFIVGDLPLPDSPDQVVVEIVKHVGVDDQILAGVKRLKALGFRIAVDDWVGEPERDNLLVDCDLVKINLARTELLRLAGLVRHATALNPAAAIVVERIEDAEAFEAAHALGVAMFQGHYLQRPLVMVAPQLSPSEVICLRVLGLLAADEVKTDQVHAVVSGDPGLAIRVLRTASSAAAAGRPVSSLRQALALIGPRMLSSWVVLMLVGGTGRVPHDQVVTMLARAGACSTLAPHASNVAYTAGLLSGVTEILGVSTEDTIRTTGIGPEVADALLSGGGTVGTALRAVMAHERHNPQAVVANGFTPYQVSLAYLEAVRSGNAMTSAIYS